MARGITDNQTDAETEEDQLKQTDASDQFFAIACADNALECVEASRIFILDMRVVGRAFFEIHVGWEWGVK